MLKNLIMNFPILKSGCVDFLEGVSYQVEARQEKRVLEITHTLAGHSFIYQLIKSSDAKFSVLLLYQNSSERQHEECGEIKIEDDKIVAVQRVNIKFSYAPEVIPSIVLLEDKEITLDGPSGLTDFWKKSDDTTVIIPKYARIALAEKLRFTKGGFDSLFELQHNESFDEEPFGRGWMEISVDKSAGVGTPPVTVLCGQDVFDQLKKVHKFSESNAPIESNSQIESIRIAIATNVVCGLYACMQQLHQKGDDGHENLVLLEHRKLLQEKTNGNWQDDDFNPSLAATKMQPYMLDKKILSGDDSDDDSDE